MGKKEIKKTSSRHSLIDDWSPNAMSFNKGGMIPGVQNFALGGQAMARMKNAYSDIKLSQSMRHGAAGSRGKWIDPLSKKATEQGRNATAFGPGGYFTDSRLGYNAYAGKNVLFGTRAEDLLNAKIYRQSRNPIALAKTKLISADDVVARGLKFDAESYLLLRKEGYTGVSFSKERAGQVTSGGQMIVDIASGSKWYNKPKIVKSAQRKDIKAMKKEGVTQRARLEQQRLDLERDKQLQKTKWAGTLNKGGPVQSKKISMFNEGVLMAGSGKVPGTGSKDTIPALLTPGESVITKEASAKYGPILNAMNRGAIASHATGTVAAGRPQGRMARAAARIPPGAGMGASMGIGMASMLPMMMQNEEGKFMGMDAGAAMGGLVGLSMLPMLLKPAMAHPVIAGVVVAAAAVGAGLMIWRKSIDNAAKKSAEFGANIGGTSNALNNMSKMLGLATPAQQQAKMSLGFTASEQEASYGQFQPMLESETGQKFIKDLQAASSADRFKKLSDYVSSAIAAGIMDKESAQGFAKVIATQMGDSILGANVLSSIKGQAAGSEGMLSIAEKRLAAVGSNAQIQNIKNTPVGGSVSNASGSMAIGASLQIIQDYSNVIALAKREYVDGTKTFEEYIAIVKNAKDVQEEYSVVLRDAIFRSQDSGGARQALDNELVASGYTPEQIEAVTVSTDIGSAISPNTIVNGIMQAFTDQEGPFSVNAYVDQYKDRRITKGMTGLEEASIDQEAWDALGKARSLNEGGLDGTLKLAVKEGLLDPGQAAGVGDYLMKNPLSRGAEVYLKKQEKTPLAAIKSAAFAASAESQGIAGIGGPSATGKELEDVNRYIDVGLRFEEDGGSLAEYQTFILNIPEEKRIKVVTEFENLGAKAKVKTVADQTKFAELMTLPASVAIQETESYKTARAKATRQQYSVHNSGAASRNSGAALVTGLRVTNKKDEYAADQIDIAVEEAGKVFKDDEALFAVNIALRKDPEDLAAQLKTLTGDANFLLNTLSSEFMINIGLDPGSASAIASVGPYREDLVLLEGVYNGLPDNGVKSLMVDLVLGKNGKPANPAEFQKDAIEISKALDGLSSGKKKVKKEAILTLLSTVTAPDGKKLTKKQAQTAFDGLAEEYGEQRILNLPPDILTKVISLQVQAKDAEEAAKKYRSFANYAGLARDFKNQAMYQALADEASALAASANVQTETAIKTAPSGGSSSGGGDKSNPLKDFKQGLVDQIKRYADINASLKTLLKSKYNFFNLLKLNKGIAGMIRKANINPFLSEQLMGMDPKDAKKVLKGLTGKDGKLTKAGRQLDDQVVAMSIRKTLYDSQEGRRTARTQSRVAVSLRSSGESQSVIEAIAGDPTKAAEYEALLNKAKNGGKKARKALEDYTDEARKSIEVQKRLAEASNPVAYALEQISLQADAANAEIEKISTVLESQSDAEFSGTQGMTKQDMQFKIEDNQKLIDGYNKQIDVLQRKNDAEQRSIDIANRDKKPYEDEIKAIEKAIDGHQRKIDILQREMDLRSRVSDGLSHDLELMSKQEDDINKSYDKKVEALTKVQEINNNIIDQQKSQLGLAQALSEGDIYAAAASVQEIRSQNAKFAADQVMTAMEQGRKNSIEGLKSSSGMTREQIEQEQFNIGQQNYQAGLNLIALNDKVYAQNQLSIPLRDSMAVIDERIAAASERIYLNSELIYGIQTNSILPLTEQSTVWKDILEASDGKLKRDLATATVTQVADLRHLKLLEAGLSAQLAQEAAADQLNKRWKNIGNTVAKVNKLLETRKSYFDTGDFENLGSLAEYNKDESINKEQTLEAIRKEYQDEIDKVLGKLPGLAAGGVPGDGSRDSVMTRLTPGEFVVRKSMVKKYGSPMFKAINQGSFIMPRYDAGRSRTEMKAGSAKSTTANISAPVYNNFSVSVSATTNANADDIANKAVMKIKQMQNMQVRSNRG